MKYLIIETEGYEIIGIRGCFNDLLKAEQKLGDLHAEIPEDEILGWDNDHVQWEDEYGSIRTYQIIGFNDNNCN